MAKKTTKASVAAVAALTNPFSAFVAEEQTVFIAALGTEITYRPLTMIEGDHFRAKMIKEFDDQGKPVIDVDASQNIKYEKVALMLIEPSITAEELKSLSGSASIAIDEILALLGDDDEVDAEGN